MVERRWPDHELILVDDLHLVMNIVESCNYPRAELFNAALTAVLDQATSLRRKLVFVVEDQRPVANSAAGLSRARLTILLLPISNVFAAFTSARN